MHARPISTPDSSPHTRAIVVGIDLGTTFSVAAVNEHGTVRVINDTTGDPLVPSIVSFLPKVKHQIRWWMRWPNMAWRDVGWSAFFLNL